MNRIARQETATCWMSIACDGAPVRSEVARFRGASGVEEIHVTVRPCKYGAFGEQLAWLQRGLAEVEASLGIDARGIVLRRLFCSDLVNQVKELSSTAFSAKRAQPTPCAMSWIGQPPSPPAKVAAWVYYVVDPSGELVKHGDGDALAVRRGGLTHHWVCGLAAKSADESGGMFAQYDAWLSGRGLRLADHAVRTWLFLRDIDADYWAMATARREFFATRGLTSGTHYIASTGIGAEGLTIAAPVMLDAYAVAGLSAEQMGYLRVLRQLSATDRYGVTFERATSIDYADRRHLYISGTASIDADGVTLHAGDLLAQLERTLENIEALLREGGAMQEHLCHLIAYVRDWADGPIVELELRARWRDLPILVTRGAVCRPGWLIEIEGMAVVPTHAPSLPAF